MSEEHCNVNMSNTSKITPIKYTKIQCQSSQNSGQNSGKLSSGVNLVNLIKIEREREDRPVNNWNLRDITKDIKKELNLNYSEREIEEQVEPEDLFTPKNNNFNFIERINLNFTFNKIKERESTPQANTAEPKNEAKAIEKTDENLKTKEKYYLNTKDSCSPVNEEQERDSRVNIPQEHDLGMMGLRKNKSFLTNTEEELLVELFLNKLLFSRSVLFVCVLSVVILS